MRAAYPLLAFGATLLGAWPAGADVAARIAGDLRLAALGEAGDVGALSAAASDPALPGAVRARALYALLSPRKGSVTPEVRGRVLSALSDPSPEVRAAGLRLVGERQDRALENEALRHATEDPDPRARVEALRAIRPWTSPRHLFFLEQALAAPWPTVQAEALRNLAELPPREAPPKITSAVDALANRGNPTEVRLAALETLRDWGRLTWPKLGDVLSNDTDSEALRLFAVRASDGFRQAENRDRSLLDILASAPSPLLSWEAFRRLRASAGEGPELPDRTARFLKNSGQQNAASEEMAAYLRDRGYRAEYLSGAWKITKR